MTEQRQLTIAYKALVNLYGKTGIPVRISRELFLLKRDLEPHVLWQQEQERKAQQENSDGLDELGNFIMNREQAERTRERFMEIQKTEVKWRRPPVVFPISDQQAAELGITGRVMDDLYGFVNFTEVEEQ